MEFLVRVLGNAAGLWLTSALISGITVAGQNDTRTLAVNLLAIGLLLTIVNSVVKPVVKALSFPLYLLSFGLFALAVNGVMLLFTSWLTSQVSSQANYPLGLHVDSFGAAVVGSLLIALISAIVVGVIGPDKD